MGAITSRAARENHRVVLLGDMNSAPEGGRWKYKPSKRFSRFDREMNEWVRNQDCREIAGSKLQHTWAMRHGAQRAALDRAFIHPAHEESSRLIVTWHQAVFDHAMITVRLPHSTAGIGYAGASRPETAALRVPRCKVDLKKWKTRKEEWVHLLKQSLDHVESNEEGLLRDPFQALKHGEAVAEAIAIKLAPRRIPKAGEVRRSFCFSGHRLLLRELNWLREARVFVGGVLQGSPEVWRCPHRAARWSVVVSQLSRRLQRSGFPRPPDLPSHLPSSLTRELREALTDWLTHAKTASEVRRAAISDDFAQARFLNAQNFRSQLMKSGGVLDRQALQAALGKRQPRQRMWGLSGPAVLGLPSSFT
jgi:hypothetical protein